jgi:hypothetical protein
MLGQMDFSHPLFAPFADPRYSDFTKIRFWKHRIVNTNALAAARVVARFDDGHPALIHLPLGSGSLLVLASGWHPADSQLALSSKFVPLLHSILEMSGAIQPRLSQYVVGDELPLPATNGLAAVTMSRPDGSQLDPAGGGRFDRADLPGIYTVRHGNGESLFAVNLPPEESETSPMPVEELESYGVPMNLGVDAKAGGGEAARRQLRATELESRQKLWRWLLVAALAFLMMESWLAGRLSQTA